MGTQEAGESFAVTKSPLRAPLSCATLPLPEGPELAPPTLCPTPAPAGGHAVLSNVSLTGFP